MQQDQPKPRALIGGGALLPIWQMNQAQFEAAAIVVAVDVVMKAGKLHLEPADDAGRRALERLQSLAARHPPAGVADPQQWAAGGVKRVLAAVFQDDVFVSALSNIAHVVLVKATQIEGLQLSEVIRRVHMRQVEAALAHGMDVPEAVRNEYRESMERMHVLPATGSRETLH